MSFQPQEFLPLAPDELRTLKRRQAQVLCWMAEAVIGEHFGDVIGGAAGKEAGYRAFLHDLDEFLDYQARGTIGQLHLGMKFLEEAPTRRLFLVREGHGDFSRMSLADRRAVLQALKTDRASNAGRQLFAGAVRLITSFYFGHQNAWPSIGYRGPSVDDQTVLDGHPWRPNDPRPVEPC